MGRREIFFKEAGQAASHGYAETKDSADQALSSPFRLIPYHRNVIGNVRCRRDKQPDTSSVPPSSARWQSSQTVLVDTR
jgi:hypothetical protein